MSFAVGAATRSMPSSGEAAFIDLIEVGSKDTGPGCSGITSTALIMKVKWVVSLTTCRSARATSTRVSGTHFSASSSKK